MVVIVYTICKSVRKRMHTHCRPLHGHYANLNGERSLNRNGPMTLSSPTPAMHATPPVSVTANRLPGEMYLHLHDE